MADGPTPSAFICLIFAGSMLGTMIRARKSGSGKPQGIEARIAQLEDLHRSRNEILVVWRRPGAPVSKALRNLDYGPGDRVVCFEWFGSGAPPQPQWRNDLRRFSKEEDDSIDIMLQRILDAKPSHEHCWYWADRLRS
jgi:hypothetical protein